MDEWLNRDLLARLLALAVAVILWFVVVGDEQGAQKATLQASLTERIWSVPLVPRGLEPGLVVTSMPHSVDVRVRGSLGALRGLEPRVRAELSLPGRGEGRGLVRVSPTVPRGLEVVSVEPSSVVIDVERIEKRTMPISVSLIGNAGVGYRAGSSRVEPTNAQVQGPSGKVARVRLVLAAVDVTSKRQAITQEASLQAVDRHARPVDGVTIRPRKARVSVPVMVVVDTAGPGVQAQ